MLTFADDQHITGLSTLETPFDPHIPPHILDRRNFAIDSVRDHSFSCYTLSADFDELCNDDDDVDGDNEDEHEEEDEYYKKTWEQKIIIKNVPWSKASSPSFSSPAAPPPLLAARLGKIIVIVIIVMAPASLFWKMI